MAQGRRWKRSLGCARLFLAAAQEARGLKASLMAMVCGNVVIELRAPKAFKAMPRLTINFFVLSMDAHGHIVWPVDFAARTKAALRKQARTLLKRMLDDDLHVVSGLRLGAEQLGAEAAVADNIPLVAVLPFPDPDSPWPESSRRRFRRRNCRLRTSSGAFSFFFRRAPTPISGILVSAFVSGFPHSSRRFQPQGRAPPERAILNLHVHRNARRARAATTLSRAAGTVHADARRLRVRGGREGAPRRQGGDLGRGPGSDGARVRLQRDARRGDQVRSHAGGARGQGPRGVGGGDDQGATRAWSSDGSLDDASPTTPGQPKRGPEEGFKRGHEPSGSGIRAFAGRFFVAQAQHESCCFGRPSGRFVTRNRNRNLSQKKANNTSSAPPRHRNGGRSMSITSRRTTPRRRAR